MSTIQPNETWCMEQFGRAYVEAVASVARCSVTVPSIDDDSIDLTFARRSTSGFVRSPRLEAQLKTTYAVSDTNGSIAYPLKIKNYDDLRAPNVAVPRILIVVVVPEVVEDWVDHSRDQMALRHCGYWLSLRGKPTLANTTKATVRVPASQVFDSGTLHEILERLGDGGLP